MEDPPAINEEEVMEVAAALSPSERAAYLDTACRSHPDLRVWIEQRLAFPKGEGVKASTIRVEPIEPTESAKLRPEVAGNRLGNYKLLQQIGEGSFGTVWVAEQHAPVKRRVALKIVKLGMDTKEVIARFEQERQALALMDHPNIAKVFDAGITETGRPYFVMELVKGIKITDYCDQSRLSTVDRLKLFIQVCRAVQHAHQKGIIHRDIKPSNILVAFQDGVAVPKMIDFGVAKTLQQHKLTELTIFTYVEQMIGTPAYMSPEQADGSGLDIDTRSDIYSLGVLLYELLTGQTPFDIKKICQRGFDEVRRVLREQEPKRPSTVLLTMAADTRIQVAHKQQADQTTLIGVMRRDLDWIAMKALEKERARRYETAADLGADVERYLNRQPILARPPSKRYRMRRFVSRHKAGVASAVAVAAALMIGCGVSISQAVRASREANRANEAIGKLKVLTPSLAAHAQGLIAVRKIDEAILVLGSMIDLEPKIAGNHRERAFLLLGQVKVPEAAEGFRRALALDPGDQASQQMLKLCDRLSHMQRAANGKLPRPALEDLFTGLKQANRSAAELMPLARVLEKESMVNRQYCLERLRLLQLAPERLKVGSDDTMELDLSRSAIEDLTPLADLPISSLNLFGCSGVKSIEALQKMHLGKLDISGTKVTTLEPLKNMSSLRRLELKNAPIADLTPLENLALNSLGLAHTDVNHLDPLKKMPLERLDISNTKVTDIQPIANLPLRVLECSNTPIESYKPLANSLIEVLVMHGAKNVDLGILQNLPLRTLSLRRTADLKNFAALGKINSLQLLLLPSSLLALDSAEILAIDALRDHPGLTQISFKLKSEDPPELAEGKRTFWQTWDNMMQWWRPLHAAGFKAGGEYFPNGTWRADLMDHSFQDLSVFTGTNVSYLNLTQCRSLRDLSKLGKLDLKILGISQTGVDDLSPISKYALEELWMAGTPVRSLEPLRGMPLKKLYMNLCDSITDVSVVAELRDLKSIILPLGATGVEKLQSLPKLEYISYSYDQRTGNATCKKNVFFQKPQSLQWAHSLRRQNIKFDYEQLPDTTWRVKIRNSQFSDLTALKGALIIDLSLHGTTVSNVTHLVDLPLRKLRLDETPCTDVSPLARIPTLESVVLPRGAINVESLRSLPLTRIGYSADTDGLADQEADAFWKAFPPKEPR